MTGQVLNTSVTARKRHRCEGFGCRAWIEPGQPYVRTVMFPGDVNSNDRPWVMRICDACWAPRDWPTREPKETDA